MTKRPKWTPEQQEMIDYFFALDKVSFGIAGYMMGATNLPLKTIRKLLLLAEIAWRDKDPKGSLVFFDIDSASPRVEYVAGEERKKITVRYLLAHRCSVVPLEVIFYLVTHQAKGVQ